MEINASLFIAPNGKLYSESRIFVKACLEVEGVRVCELWCDSYQMNDPYKEVLIPGDIWPFDIDESWSHLPPDKFGGVRLDIFCHYKP